LRRKNCNVTIQQSMFKKKVLITGGCGFLGCHLARGFLKKNYSVTLLDTAKLDSPDLIGKVSYIKTDIRNKKNVFKAVKGHEVVVHAAAALPIVVSKEKILGVNVEGTRNILEASLKNKVKRFVFISTTAVYGVPKELPEKETSQLKPIGFYGESKLAAEDLCLGFMKKGLEINILRPKTFLGPERLGVFELWFDAIYNGRKVIILGKGENRYQLLAVSDIVDAIIKAVESPVKNQIFNLGAKNFGTWKSDLTAVIKFARSKSEVFGFPVLPSQVALWILEKMRLSPIAEWHYRTLPVNSYVSISRAEHLLKWHPKKSNKDLLIENYRWYKIHRNDVKNKTGNTHRVGWDFKVLNLVRKLI